MSTVSISIWGCRDYEYDYLECIKNFGNCSKQKEELLDCIESMDKRY